MRQRAAGAALVCGLLAATGLSCTPRSPFARSPADVALSAPCRYMGTFHRESRGRLEKLRICRLVSDAQWGCMARELKALDVAFTGRCRSQSVAVDDILADQRTRYGRCLAPEAAPVAACAALADDDACRCVAGTTSP